MSPGAVEYAMFCVTCGCMVGHGTHRCPNCAGFSFTTSPPTQRDAQFNRIELKLNRLLEAQMTTQADVDAITKQLTQVSDDIGAARAALQAEIDKLATAQPATDLSGLQAAANKLDPAVVALGQITPTPAAPVAGASGPGNVTVGSPATTPVTPPVTMGVTPPQQGSTPPGTVIGGAVVAPGTVVGGAGATPAEAGTPAPAVDPANPPPIPLPGQ